MVVALARAAVVASLHEAYAQLDVAAEPFVFEETAQGKALWKRQHATLFAGYTRGIHQYYATGHNIHRENPGAVADAIRFVGGFGASEAAK